MIELKDFQEGTPSLTLIAVPHYKVDEYHNFLYKIHRRFDDEILARRPEYRDCVGFACGTIHHGDTVLCRLHGCVGSELRRRISSPHARHRPCSGCMDDEYSLLGLDRQKHLQNKICQVCLITTVAPASHHPLHSFEWGDFLFYKTKFPVPLLFLVQQHRSRMWPQSKRCFRCTGRSQLRAG